MAEKGRPRRNSIPEEDWEKVVKMYEQGASLKNIAKLYDCTPYIVKGVLYYHDVKIRPQGRPPKDSPIAEVNFKLLNILTNPVGGNDGS
jgi:hypothetical protein